MAVRVEVLDRDWRTLRRILGYQVPLVAFVVVLGAANFSWPFAAIAVVAPVLTWALLVLIQRPGIRGGRLAEASYVIRASIARRPGRLELDRRGLSWWAYKEQGGDPEFTVSWPSVDHVTIQPVAAFVPICRLRISAAETPQDGFVVSLGVRTLERLLGNVLA